MNEERLREDLEKTVLPDEDGARQRAWELIAAAHRERGGTHARTGWLHRRLRLVAASAAILGGLGLVLTPAGADVRDWIGDVIDPGNGADERALTHLPAPGKILVRSGSELWTVENDGSRRLLGEYEGGSWSPHGLYVAASAGRRLVALDPQGEIRWSITRGRVEDPRWSLGNGYRVAYRSGSELRVVWGDGTNDRGFGQATPVAPAWRPGVGVRHVLAYVDGRDRARILDVDTGESKTLTSVLRDPVAVEWSGDGAELLVLSAGSIRALDAHGVLEWKHRFPPGQRAAAASFDGSARATAVVRAMSGEWSSVVSLESRGDGAMASRVFTGSGSFDGVHYSPDRARFVIGWPDADQWLFFPTKRTRKVFAAGDIAKQFGAGAGSRGFPIVEDWCCDQPP